MAEAKCFRLFYLKKSRANDKRHNKQLCLLLYMAGVQGFEPWIHGSEPCALPLGDTPATCTIVHHENVFVKR